MNSPSSDHPSTALVLIDFQKDFLDPAGRMPVARSQVGSVIEAANAAAAGFRAAGLPIIAVGNEFKPGDFLMNLLRRFASIAGSPGAVWDARIPLQGARYFPKWAASAFSNPELEPYLKQQAIRHLVLTGLMARACVSATAKAALKKGFRVSTMDDAIACASDGSRRRALDRLHRAGVERFDPASLPTR